jgi:glycosyltransferase involved in cell wall biosynthesis
MEALIMTHVKLSICISTYNRGAFIGETVDSIIAQLEPDVELIVVDGASPDNTPDVMGKYLLRHPEIRYFRERENSGIDRDYDKAISYARGEYCWLMTDDDLLMPRAINTLLCVLNESHDLIVVNAETWNSDFSRMIKARHLQIYQDRCYKQGDHEALFVDAFSYLSYIGGVVIKRSFWLARKREPYYGTLFVHLGVIYQSPPVDSAYLVSEPVIKLRFGNSTWNSNAFEIWIIKYPDLAWSFADFSRQAKEKACPRLSCRRVLMQLFHFRATGSYTIDGFKRFMSKRTNGVARYLACIISIFPRTLANALGVLYISIFLRNERLLLYEVLNSPYATKVSLHVIRAMRMTQYLG